MGFVDSNPHPLRQAQGRLFPKKTRQAWGIRFPLKKNGEPKLPK